MDYASLKIEIQEIAQIADSVPEPFREKCFEMLLRQLLADSGPTRKPETKSPDEERQESSNNSQPGSGTKIPVKAQLRVFMQRTGVTLDQLEQLVLVDGNEVHFVKEPAHGKIAKGQIDWALLLALKNAIQANEFSADPEDVRSICQEKGFYDKGNFATVFKRPPYSSYFRQPLQPQGPRQTLTNDGQTALAELIAALTQTQ